MTGLDRVRALLNDSLDLAIIAIFIAVCVTPVLPGIQKRWQYLIAAFALGTVGGLICRRLGLPDGLDILGVCIGFVSGPVTMAKLQGKTVKEVVEELRQMRLDL